MKNIFASIQKALSNPKTQKILFMILLVIVILYILSKVSTKFRLWIRSFLGPQGDDVNAPVTPDRQDMIENLARNIKTEIDNEYYLGVGGQAELLSLIQTALFLPDNEFYQLALYYSKSYAANIYDDVDGYTFPSSSVADENFLRRLEEMNIALL